MGRRQSFRALLGDAVFRARPRLCSSAPLPTLRALGQSPAEQGEKLGPVQGQHAAAEEPGLETRAAWLWVVPPRLNLGEPVRSSGPIPKP